MVKEFGWLTEGQFVDAVAVAMITPGPVVITVGFIGYLVAGFPGACVAALATFLPCYIFTVALAPSFKKIAKNTSIKAFVDGITAAVIGALVGSVIVIGFRSIKDIPTILIAIAAVLALIYSKKLQEPYIIGAAAVIGLLIRQNPKSPVALFAVYELAKPISNPPDFPSAFRLLDPLLQQSPLGNSISKMIVSHNFYVVGNTFPDFMQPDVTGKLIRTADFRGKYLFVDFWASWCGPCRLESPHLKRAFDRHKKDGLVVLSVSIDDSKEKWLNAIKQDQTGEFLHVGDMKGRENAAAQLLKVNMIPQNFLIDPQGKIIGKNLLGIELDEIMKKIYR